MSSSEKPELAPHPNTSETPQSMKPSIYIKLIILGIIVIIALQAYIILSDQSQTIIHRGVTFTLYNKGPSSQRQAIYSFTTIGPSVLTGVYETTNPVLGFVMTAEQYSNYTCCSSPRSFLYGTSVNIIVPLGFSWILNYRLSGGVYYLVFLNDYIQNATVIITDSIIFTPP